MTQTKPLGNSERGPRRKVVWSGLKPVMEQDGVKSQPGPAAKYYCCCDEVVPG